MQLPPPSPFHAGEIAIQQQLGVAARMAQFASKVVRDYMPDQHRLFYAQLPFMVLATVDAQGDPWATLLEGEPGFATSPEPTLLDFSVAPAEQDPARPGWQAGAAIGLLGIELHTRRRNRVNGCLQPGRNGLQLKVEHAFGNCPQYIQARGLHFAYAPGTRPIGPVGRGQALDSAATAMIGAADTFFVASYVDLADGVRAVDASHRGGKAGFVRVQDNRLSIPDFAGNLHFNTLGNFLVNPRAGLLFVDFSSGDVLQLVGRVVLDFEADEVRFFQGAERLWHLDVERWVLRRGALALRGDVGEARGPRGSFTVDAQQVRPLVLISVGVGITPMLAMLRHVVYEGVRKRRIRRTWFIHGSRNERERSFVAEVAQLAESARGAVRVVQVLKEPGPEAREGVDFDARGRVDLGLLKSVLPFDDFDFHLCGPSAFMEDLYSGLRALHVPNERIHAESFGPAGLQRDGAAALPPASSKAVPVLFAASGKEARWTPGSGSLLDLAESRGLNPAHSCRQGLCGSCSHVLTAGNVTYVTSPSSGIETGRVLLCQAVPAQGSGRMVVEA